MINHDRRNAILKTLQGVGAFTFGGLIWSAYLSKANANSFSLRPPGARKEDEFIKLCIKCGRCVIACPYHTLKLAKPEDNLLVGTPYFIPREIPCYMCVDIPCVPVCPTKALDSALVSNDKKELDINKARMGVAIVDNKSCVAYWGIQCDACYRSCPLIDKAIKLDYKQNTRTEKHSYLLPIVDSDVCTGCGLCERACITKKPAIIVMPREKVLGEVGTNYIKGWDSKDENRLNELDSKPVESKKDDDSKQVLDYLNNGDI